MNILKEKIKNKNCNFASMSISSSGMNLEKRTESSRLYSFHHNLVTITGFFILLQFYLQRNIVLIVKFVKGTENGKSFVHFATMEVEEACGGSKN